MYDGRTSILVIEDSTQSGFGGGQRVTAEVLQSISGLADVTVVDLCQSRLLNLAKQLGFRTKVIGHLSRKWPYLRLLRVMELILGGSLHALLTRPDSIYVPTRLSFFPALIGKLIRPSTRIVYHYHILSSSHWILRKFDRMVFRFSHRVVFASEFLHDAIVTTDSRFKTYVRKVIMPAMPAKWSEPTSSPRPVKSSLITIGYIGKLSQVKGVLLLLEALKHLPHSLNWNCAIYGDGPLKKEVSVLATDPVFGGRVAVKGTVDATLDIYRGISVLVVPSFEWTETIGLTALEGIQAGIAVLAANHGNLRTFLQAGQAFELDSPNPAAIAKRIEAVVGQILDGSIRLPSIEYRGAGKARFEKFAWDLFALNH